MTLKLTFNLAVFSLFRRLWVGSLSCPRISDFLSKIFSLTNALAFSEDDWVMYEYRFAAFFFVWKYAEKLSWSVCFLQNFRLFPHLPVRKEPTLRCPTLWDTATALSDNFRLDQTNSLAYFAAVSRTKIKLYNMDPWAIPSFTASSNTESCSKLDSFYKVRSNYNYNSNDLAF